MVGISLLLLPLPLLLNSPLVQWTLDPELCGCLGGQHRAPCCEQGLMKVWQAQAPCWDSQSQAQHLEGLLSGP